MTHWKGVHLQRPCAIDLFCGGGGAGRGLIDAGFRTVVGVDREKHRTSYEHLSGMHFVQMDVDDVTAADLKHFDFVWASPPCQAYTGLIPRAQREKHSARWHSEGRHRDMVPKTREMLKDSGVSYIIENVPGSPLESPIRLCGTMFDLSVFRHRHFESNLPLVVSKSCKHANCSNGALVRHTRQPRTEKCVDGGDAQTVPEGFERQSVCYPCRNGERNDFIYRGVSDETKSLLKQTYGRSYARSMKEVLRITGTLLPLSADEYREEVEKANSAKKIALKPGQRQMYPVYGAATKSRGTTEEWREALQCPWMTREELAQAIPPAYSKYLGEQVLQLAETQNLT